MPKFPTTRKQLVFAAARPETPDGHKALRELCSDYWPLVQSSFASLVWGCADKVRDFTQGFFAHLLKRNAEGHNKLVTYRAEKGRFRSWLWKAMRRHLKRQRIVEAPPPEVTLVSLDAPPEGRGARPEPAAGVDTEWLCDRQRALKLLGQVLEQLRGEYERRGEGATFDQLLPCLTTGLADPYGELARTLGKKEGAVRVAADRLKDRYCKLLDAALAASAGGKDRTEAERKRLLRALDVHRREDEGEPAAVP